MEDYLSKEERIPDDNPELTDRELEIEILKLKAQRNTKKKQTAVFRCARYG